MQICLTDWNEHFEHIVYFSRFTKLGFNSMIGMKILLFLLLQTSQFFQIEGIEDVYYSHNGIFCVKCPRGHKITNHCTKEYHNSECVLCEEGTYAVRLSSSEQCGKCKDCSQTDQIIKNNCTPERDTECQCPDKKYFDSDFCKTCKAPRVKRVNNDKESCEDCGNGYYYNNTKEDCVKCDICTKHQVILQVCNVTHNAVCKQIPTTSPSTINVSSTNTVSSAEKNEDGLSDGDIAGIVISLIIIIIIIVIVGLIIICKKKNMYCFREKENGEKDEEAGEPLTGFTTRDVQSSQSKVNDNGAEAHLTGNGDLAENSISSHEPNGRKYSETQNNLPQFEAFGASTKPEWLNVIRRILIDNLDRLDVFGSHLGSDGFNATAKWKQLDGKNIESRFYEFMDIWYEKTIDPSLEKIISVLQLMNTNDIIEKVMNDGYLNQQLNQGNVSSDDHTVQSDNQCRLKHPIQASDDGHVDYPGKGTDSVDNQKISFGLAQNTAMACRPQPSMESKKDLSEQNSNGNEQTHAKEIDGPYSEEDQTNPKQFLVE